MKNRIIIVEGPQGTGKTTLTNYLRENISSSNLYRLSGQKDKTITGLEISKKMYQALINYLKEMQDIPMDIIFDRTFFTEQIYSKLGYKDYDFTDTYNYLLKELLELKYDIYYLSLYLENPELFKTRLERNSHHNYQAFSRDNSFNQQQIYKVIAEELKNTNINVHEIAMDNFEEAYKEVNKILKIELR